MRALPIFLLFCLGIALAAPSTPAARGKRLFHDTQGLEYPSCAQCHSLLSEQAERKQAKNFGPGATLYGAVVREGWRNRNTYADVGAASQTCAKQWQRRKQGLKAAQRADLVAFLKTAAPAGPLPKRKVRRPKLMKDYRGGDAAKGKVLMERYCAGCHNKSDESISIPLPPKRKKKDLIARTVRGYDAKLKFRPKTMSYYTTERLSDADLRHIVAYLGR